MTTNKPLQMVMRDMLFVTWAVQPEIVRNLVDGRLELDTRTDADGREVALVSAVCFHATEVRSSILPLPGLNFGQVNYRVYVKADEVPSVWFLAMKVNSRMITAMTSFLSIPVHYEEIEITTSSGPGLPGYSVISEGLRAEAIIGERDDFAQREQIEPDFITQRPVGYAGTANATFRIDVQHSRLEAVPARAQNVASPSLERLGLLTPDQSANPNSVLYVREAVFGADTPVRER